MLGEVTADGGVVEHLEEGTPRVCLRNALIRRASLAAGAREGLAVRPGLQGEHPAKDEGTVCFWAELEVSSGLWE